MATHNPFRICLIVAMTVVFLIMIVFNSLAGNSAVKGLFVNSTGDVSDKYYIELTPAGWTFSIWGVIYTWQVLWVIYAIAAIFRTLDGEYLYTTSVLPPVVYGIYMLNCCLNIAWLFLFDREFLIPACVVLALFPATLYTMLFISFRRLYNSLGFLHKISPKDIWLIRIIVQNAFAIYAAWTTIATLLNFTMVLTYSAGVPQDVSTTVSLSILTVELLLWFCLDNFVFDKYVRYTPIPYFVVVFALSGGMAKNFNLISAFRNSVFLAVLTSIAGGLLIIKIVLMIWRHFKRPINHCDVTTSP